MTIDLNMYTTAALGLAMYYIGVFLRKRIQFLETFCIPAPVVGGLLFAILNLIFHSTGIAVFKFDETLKTFFMVIFFTTIGFQADFNLLKAGGRSLVIFTALTTGLIILQNLTGITVASLLGTSPLFGMCTGSIPMVGGHGTAAAFGPVLEEAGLPGATTYTTAVATYGVVASGLIGGPVCKFLIRKYNLAEERTNHLQVENTGKNENKNENFMYMTKACFMIIFAMGIGVPISQLISQTGFTIPIGLGPMIVACAIRNFSEKTGKHKVPMLEIQELSSISLILFLGIAMISLRLWELADLALPLIVLLGIQTVITFLYSRFLVFPLMGSDYDSAVIVSGLLGFGLGATPNAMANMQSVCTKYDYSKKAFMIVPIVGALLIDFINAGLITVFLNFL